MRCEVLCAPRAPLHAAAGQRARLGGRGRAQRVPRGQLNACARAQFVCPRLRHFPRGGLTRELLPALRAAGSSRGPALWRVKTPPPCNLNAKERRFQGGGQQATPTAKNSSTSVVSVRAFISRQLRGFATKQRSSCAPRPPWSTRPTCTSSRPSRSCSTFLRAAALAPSCRERHLDHAEARLVTRGDARDHHGRALLRVLRAAARELRGPRRAFSQLSDAKSALPMGARRSNSTPPSP